MTSTKNLHPIMKKIVDGTAPPKFTVAHLKGLGFKSSNDQGIIPVLKDLKFLTADGTPTQRYHDYRDPSKSKVFSPRRCAKLTPKSFTSPRNLPRQNAQPSKENSNPHTTSPIK